jgi:hypothetical protein
MLALETLRASALPNQPTLPSGSAASIVDLFGKAN